MSEVVRRGTIILDLIGGKIDLPVPDLNPVLNARQKELDLLNQLDEATRRLKEAQEAAAEAGQKLVPGGGGGGGGTSPAKPIDDAADAARKLEQGLKQAGEGFFRLSRAVVLLGSDSDESFQKMIQGLAYVQAGFDLFKGSQQIIEGLSKAEDALAAARARETAATVANTAANAANTAATGANTAAKGAAALGSAALAVVLNPVTLALVALGAAVMAVVEAWDYFTVSENEAAEASERLSRAVQGTQQAMDKMFASQKAARDLQREGMDDAERMASLQKEFFQGIGGGQAELDLLNTKTPGAEVAGRNSAAAQFGNAAQALREQKALQEQINAAQKQGIDDQVTAIENAQRLVDQAQKQVDLEKQKAAAFEAQVGGLSALQQRQLTAFRDRLRNGDDLSKREEDRFAELGGDFAESIVAHRRSKRAREAGFNGEDFFKGIEGAGTGLDDAAKKLKEAADALAKLTDGATAAAKIAELEAQKSAIDAKFAEFMKGFNKNIDELIAQQLANAERIATLETTMAINAAAGQ